ncbi:unnamed protein product [Effrenium voratum]|nr:unnamed protein product [Effrenium voratum]
MVISSALLRLSVPSLLSLLPWPSHALVSIGGAGASRIFVGSESDAAELRDANIGAVVEIAGSKPLMIIDRPDGLRGARVSAQHWDTSLQEALGFVRKEMAHGTSVLLSWTELHCESGAAGAAIAIAAVMAEDEVKFDEAVKRVGGLHHCTAQLQTSDILQRLSKIVHKAGYTPWAWAALFDAAATAQRMEDMAEGKVDLEPQSFEGESPEEEVPIPVRQILCPDFLLWPPATARSWDDEVNLILGPSLQVEVRMPADIPSASILSEQLRYCLQALAGDLPVLVPVLRAPCDSMEVSEDATQSDVDLWLDPSLDGFQVKLTNSKGPGRVELVGGNIWALGAGVEALRQLALHRRASSSLSARLPALCLRGPEPRSAVFIDLWKLPLEEQSQVLRQLARWQIRRFWVPLPANYSSLWFRDVFEARRTCSAIGAEITPVLTHDGLDHGLVPALAQFQGCCTVGLRLSRTEELGKVWPAMRSAGLSSARLVAILSQDLRSQVLHVECFCEQLNSGRYGPAARTGLLLESDIDNPEVETEVVQLGAAYGLSVGILMRSSSMLPLHIWHPQSGRASVRATKMWHKVETLSQVHGFGDAVVEVPVFGAPWAGSGTAWRPSWCLLSGFLAAGLSAPAPGARLLQLLAAQIFGDASTELARELWDAPAPAEHADFARSLLALLTGELSQVETKAANAWYAHLSERRQNLRRFEATAKLPDVPAAAILASALVGIEWLRYACRVLLLVAKHSALSSLSSLQALPPAKGSDVRNGFLALLHRTVHGIVDLPEGWWEETEDSDKATEGHLALWSGGLRLGAALDLQPWRSLKESLFRVFPEWLPVACRLQWFPVCLQCACHETAQRDR